MLKAVLYISISTRSFSGVVGNVLHDGLVRSRQEYDLAVRGLGHRLHGFEVANLHGRGRGEDIGGLGRRKLVFLYHLWMPDRMTMVIYLTHQFGRLHLGTGSDDFALTDPLGLSRHGERVLQLIAEDDVFDEH